MTCRGREVFIRSEPAQVLWKKKTTLGVDVGEFALKVCRLENPSRCSVSQRELVPERTSLEQQLPSNAALNELLLTMAGGSGSKDVRLNLSVADHALSAGYLEISKGSSKELEVSVPAAVGREIPHNLGELDLFTLPVPALRDSSKLGVFFMGTPKAGVAAQRARFAEMKWEVQAVEPALLALVRGITRNKPAQDESLWGAIACGFRTTTLTLFKGAHPYFSRSFRMGGGDFTYAFQMGEQISWSAAEERKRSYQVSSRDFQVEPFVQKWCREVQRSLTFGIQKVPEVTPKSLVLTGGTALWKGLDDRLSEVLAMPVQREGWTQLKPSEGGSDKDVVFFDLALGLVSRT